MLLFLISLLQACISYRVMDLSSETSREDPLTICSSTSPCCFSGRGL